VHVEVARRVAEEVEVGFEDLCEQTDRNFDRLFSSEREV